MAAPGQGPDPPAYNNEPIPAVPINVDIGEEDEDPDPEEDPIEEEENSEEEEEDPEELDSDDDSCITYEYIPTPPRPSSIPQSPLRPVEIYDVMMSQCPPQITFTDRPRTPTPPREVWYPAANKGKDVAGPSGTKPVEVPSFRYSGMPEPSRHDMSRPDGPTEQSPVHRFEQRDFQTFEQLLAQMKWFARYIRRDGRQPMNVYLVFFELVRRFYESLRADGVPVDPETFVTAMTQVLPTNDAWTAQLTRLSFSWIYRVEDWLRELESFVIRTYM